MAICALILRTHGPCNINLSVLISVLVVLATAAVGCGGDSPRGAPATRQDATFIPTATVTSILESSPSPTPLATLAATSRSLAPVTSVPSPTPALAQTTPSVDALADVALGYLTGILDNLGPRQSATQQELEAAEYLAAQFENFGYTARLQPFTIEAISWELSSMVVTAPDPEVLEVVPLVRSAAGEVSGNLISVGLATEDDIPEGDLEGMVALAERGVITFEEKTNRLAQVGVVAVGFYNNQPGGFQGVLLTPSSIPVLSISREDGLRIEESLTTGKVEVRVTVEAEVHDSRNLIAEKPGPGNDVVVLGGHYDTVPNISGANDNSSGTAVLLTIAQELSQEPLPFSVRFIAFGSEELGLLGSRHYVESLTSAERERIRAMFNFDAVGTGNIGLLGSKELTGLAEKLAVARRIDATVSPGLQGGDSDHSSFADQGIPVLMFFGDDFSRIHTPADTLEAVSPKLLGSAATLALALLSSGDLLSILE